MKRLLLTLCSCLFVAAPHARADLTWDVAGSTFGAGDTPFVEFTAPIGKVGLTGGFPTAIGASFSQPSGLLLGFVNTVTISGTPTLAQTDLAATPLSAGTVLKLRFTKAADDKIRFIGLLADPNQPIAYTAIDSTSFTITARVANPVQSASGDAGAAFGLLIVTEPIVNDFGGTIFATDLHWLDIGIPQFGDTLGVVAISGNGKAGVASTTTAIIPVDKLVEFGLSEATAGDLLGYIDGVPVSGGNFTNYGISSPADFEFLNPDANPQNKVLRASITSSSWSKHDLQYGVLQTDAKPTVTVTGKLSRTVTSATTIVKGTATDDKKVSGVQCSTKSAKAGFAKAKTFSKGKWSCQVSGLQKGKTKKLYVRAKDSGSQYSPVVTVTIKRAKK